MRKLTLSNQMTRSPQKLFVAMIFVIAASSVEAFTCPADDDGPPVVCSKEDVRRSDSELANGVETLLSVFSDSQRQTLIDGR